MTSFQLIVQAGQSAFSINCAPLRNQTARSVMASAFAVVIALIHLTSGMPTHAAEPGQRPNIVLCMADDQGYGDVGYYNASPVKTPVLDRMAAEGLRFDRYYAAAPVCSPTRASVMTGRHPNRLACFSWGHPLRPQETTVAEAVRAVGYTTGHFGKWHLGSTRADSPVCPGNSGFDEWLSSPNFYENDPLMSHNGEVVQTQGESSLVPVEYAVRFMERARQDNKPFLAVIWFGSPHAPHVSDGEIAKQYADFPKAQQQFLGEVTGIDQAMGHLRSELRRLGVADNTLLWYTSDNGALPEGSTAGLSGRKGNLQEGGIRVPSIIEWPAVVKQHRIINTPCSSVDIYPTVLQVAGAMVERQPVLDGTSLLPIVHGQELQRDGGLGFWVYPVGGRAMKSSQMLDAQKSDGKRWDEVEPDPSQVGGYATDDRRGSAAWIDGRFKLHRIGARGANADSQDAKFELYDLEADPAEKSNIADDQPERVAKMKAALEAWQASVIASLNGEDYVGDQR